MARHCRQASDNPIRHDIFHLLAYHRKDYDNSVLSIHNEQTRLTHNINHSPILSASVGLNLLPVEMLSAVLRFSDLNTLSTLRLVNRRTKIIVEGFNSLQAHHNPRAIRSRCPHQDWSSISLHCCPSVRCPLLRFVRNLW